MAIYRPLNVGAFPDFGKGSSFTDIFAMMDEEEKREAQRLQNEYASGNLRKQQRAQAASDALAAKWQERRAAGEPTVDELLPEMRDILGATGNVEDALQAQTVIEQTKRKDFDDAIQTKRFIMQLAKDSPEVAQKMWEEYGYGSIPDFGKLKKETYESTSGLGIWHVDDDGQIVVDKAVPKQRGPKERVLANPQTGEEMVVDISDPQAFAEAQAKGFRAKPPDSLSEYIKPPSPRAESLDSEENWFSLPKKGESREEYRQRIRREIGAGRGN